MENENGETNEILRNNGVELSFVEGKRNILVENCGRKYYRSEIKISVDESSFDAEKRKKASEVLEQFEGYTFSVWSDDELSGPSDLSTRLRQDGAFVEECGLMSNPDEFDNQDCSTVANLNAVAEERGKKKKVVLGMSCPGFGGSRLKNGFEEDENRVSVENYVKMNKFALEVLGVNLNETVLGGHSAGGEKALAMSDMVRVIAYNPAIHEDNDRFFGGINAPNSVAKFFRKGATSKVVDFLVDETVNVMVGAHGSLFKESANPSEKSQVKVHQKEGKDNFGAYLTKCRELAKPDSLPEYGGNPMVVIGGESDWLTPWKNAKAALEKMSQGKTGMRILSESDLGVAAIHHDTLFMDPKLNRRAAELTWDLLDQPMIVKAEPIAIPVAESAPEVQALPTPPLAEVEMKVAETQHKVPEAPLVEVEGVDYRRERLDVLFRWEMFAQEMKEKMGKYQEGSGMTYGEFTESYKKWILDYPFIKNVIEEKKLVGSEIMQLMTEMMADKKYQGVSYPMFSFERGVPDKDYLKVSRMVDFRYRMAMLSHLYTGITQNDKGQEGYGDTVIPASDAKRWMNGVIDFVEPQVIDGEERLSIIEETLSILT